MSGPAVQLGLGIGEPVQQVAMLAEWKDIGQKVPLIDIAAYKAKQKAKPLRGQKRMKEV